MESAGKGLLVGLLGMAMTCYAYSQDYMDPGRMVLAGLVVTLVGLGIKEGFIPV